MEEPKRPRITISFPNWAREQRLLERLQKIAKDQRRSLNFLIVDAINAFVKTVEKKRKQRR